MIRKLLATVAIAATAVLTFQAPAWSAPAPSSSTVAPHSRVAPKPHDLSYAKGTGLRKCVSTTYRARVWHTHKTRAGERCVWMGQWFPASWVVLEEPVFYAGVWWPVMQAPPRGGWRGHKPADASWWPGRESALQTL